MANLHCCIFMEYAELKELVSSWADQCSQMMVIEHPPDGKTKRVHCHFLLVGISRQENWFRDEAKKILKEFMKRGNYWIATRVQKGPHSGKPIDKSFTMIYMIKGIYEPKFLKLISKEEVEASRQLWVKQDSTSKTQDATEQLIDDIVKQFLEQFPEKNLYRKPCCSHLQLNEIMEISDMESAFEEVRKRTFKTMYKINKGRVPHASHYKIVASSAYMRICEEWGYEDTGLLEVLRKWY